jgi:hypothetical protein
VFSAALDAALDATNPRPVANLGANALSFAIGCLTFDENLSICSDLCPAGRYTDNSGAGVCVACPVGRFANL